MKTIVALTFFMFALVPAQAQVSVTAGYYNNYGRSYNSHHVGYHSAYPRYGCYGPSYHPYYGSSFGYGVTYYSQPDYSDTYSQRPNYAVSGLLLGGLTGAIIGNNSHSHDSWQGAAWGAGAGLLVGSIAEHNARKRETREAEVHQEAQAVVATQNAAVEAKPQNVTIINNYNNIPSTPMTAANGMFGR
jgi:outer membrane lipoprotein SlyB